MNDLSGSKTPAPAPLVIEWWPPNRDMMFTMLTSVHLNDT